MNNITQEEIEEYLSDVKKAVSEDRYRLDRNSRRQDNIDLFINYVIVISFHEQHYPLNYYFR